MFGSDDDTDFLPANNSKLSSLFGVPEVTGEENASFTFAAPKQPKKGGPREDSLDSTKRSNIGSVSQTTTSVPSAPEALNIIIVKAVHTFILENGKFVSQGKLGAAVLGKSTIHWYQLLLYKGKQQHVASCKITPSFEFNVKVNNYCSFTSDQGQLWSILFGDHSDAEEFARQIGLARADSDGTGDGIQVLSSQVISVQSEDNDTTASVGDSMEIYYTTRTYSAGKLGQVIESNRAAPQKVKIRKDVWEEGLIGASKGTKRMVMLPPNILGPWQSDVPPGTSLVVEVEVNRLQHARPKSPSGESAIDSSADEHSIKARGASISEALTNSPKTNKASIISRMARMGQATLPFKGAAVYHPSDSEETGDESSGLARPSVSMKTSKVRTPKARPTPVDNPVPSASNTSIPQQVAIYQQMPGNDTPWQPQLQYANNSQLYQMPRHPGYIDQVSANITSPNQNSELAIFLSEARTCNSEVRMAVSKVAEKVDQIMNKFQGVSSPTNPSSHLDPVTLLASISQIVEENQQLKAEVADKRNKLEVQSERIFSLLNTNHSYLEKSVSSDQEARTSMVVLLEEKSKLEADLEKITSLHKLCGIQEEAVRPAKDIQSESKARILLELNSKIESLREELKTSKDENRYLEDTISELLEQMLEKQSSKENLQKGLTESKECLNVQRAEAELQIKNITSKYKIEVEGLKAENEALITKLESVSTESENNSNLAVEVKKVMNAVWRSLQAIFIPGESYDGATIRQTLMSNIRDVTRQLVEQNSGVTTNTSSAVDGTKKALIEGCDVITRSSDKQESQEIIQSEEKEVTVQKSNIDAALEISKEEPPLTKEVNNAASKPDHFRSRKTIWTAPEKEIVKQEVVSPKIKEIKMEESYRPEPPPMFDEEDDDNAWYM